MIEITVFALCMAITQMLSYGLGAETMEKLTEKQNVKKYQNRLLDEKSPYLLQHAHNPVEWYPWCDEAFEKAKKENKPIFLSIGYSTCHWCHVMAHESFEDEEVAKLMNDVFVSIKVDREERPDIDNIYMTICQMITGSGGWPLTIIMTPDKKPFYAATYIPKEGRFGHAGMMELIPRVKTLWETERDNIFASADKITASLQQVTVDSKGKELDVNTLTLAYEQLAQRFDRNYGGFGKSPKFPSPQNLMFLLRYWRRTENKTALYMVEETLQAMRMGGIYDQIGFGFHRYSTDAEWLVPHFEKMLYDQAMLAMAYIETYQATGKIEYKETAREIFNYVLRDMTSPEGGFYSAEDADSEGEEGKFYIWTQQELRQILGEKDGNLIANVFNIKNDGKLNLHSEEELAGKILHLKKPLSEIASEMKMQEKVLLKIVDFASQKLFVERNKRIHPHKDDKILTDWNGLMIAAMAIGARAFNENEFSDAAERAAKFILDKLRRDDKRLLHRYRDGEAAQLAYVDDYVFFIWGLIELYETTFKPGYLQTALELNNDLLKHFWDEKGGGFYFNADDGEKLLSRQKEVYDGAIPSGNSVAMLNMVRLGRIVADFSLEEKAVILSRAFSGQIKDVPSGYAQLMVALDFVIGPSYEIVIVGNLQSEDTGEMLKAVRERFIPNKVVILKPDKNGSSEIVNLAKFTKDQKSIDGKATAYVCLNYSCRMPTTDVVKMLELLNVK